MEYDISTETVLTIALSEKEIYEARKSGSGHVIDEDYVGTKTLEQLKSSNVLRISVMVVHKPESSSETK